MSYTFLIRFSHARTLLARYATLLARYDTLLACYVTLFARYDALLARYDTLLTRYVMLLVRYNTLLARHDTLITPQKQETLHSSWQLQGKMDVVKDCQFDDILMGTGKCEELKTHRKSTFPTPHPHVKYWLPKRRIVSQYGNKIKWCALFLEYDKLVVIKLLTLAK
jgi:hypothetical protein